MHNQTDNVYIGTINYSNSHQDPEKDESRNGVYQAVVLDWIKIQTQ